MNDLTFEVLKIVMSVAVIAIARYVIPWLKMKFKNEVDEVTWVQVMRIVRAAEQTLGDYTGKDRKERVSLAVARWAQENHVNITAKQIDDLIESAVYVMNSEKGKDNG